MNYKYAIKYDIKLETREEGYTKEDADESGLADALLGISILYPPDGSYSQAVVLSLNGKTKKRLTQDEIFKVWLILGISLHDEKGLDGWKADFVELHTDTLRKFFK